MHHAATRLRFALALALALALAATSCDDDGGADDSDGTATVADTAAEDGTATVDADPTGDASNADGDASNADGDTTRPFDASSSDTDDASSSDTDAPDVPDGDLADTDAVISPDCETPGAASIVPSTEGRFHVVDGCGQIWFWGQREQSYDRATLPRIARFPEPIGEPVFTALAVQSTASCARHRDGSIYCWGTGGNGELGLGPEPIDLTAAEPRQLPGAADWRSITGGDRNFTGGRFCGIRGEGELWCWGWNGDGLLGAALPETLWEPTRIGDAANWASVSLGFDHACATRTDAGMVCWGSNDSGQLGDGTVASDATLQPPVEHAGSWRQVEATYRVTCGIQTDDSLWCWGESGWIHRLAGTGSGILRTEPTPLEVSGGLAVAEVYLDTLHAMVALTDGRVAALVRDDAGDFAFEVDGPNGDGWVDVGFTTGAGIIRSSCIGRTNGEVWCRGANDRAQLGQGTFSTLWEPTRIGGESDWTALAMQNLGSCAARPDDVWCWGQLSLFHPTNDWRLHQRPTATSGPAGVADSSLGPFGDLCAVTSAGTLHCIGLNPFQLGIEPGDVVGGQWHQVGTETTWSDVALGSGGCGVNDGQIHCWGLSADAPTPTRLDLANADWVEFAMPPYTLDALVGCGTRGGGALWCLDNTGAAYRLGTETGLSDPTFFIEGQDLWVCALDSSGNLLCGAPAAAGPLAARLETEQWRDVWFAFAFDGCGVRTDGTAVCNANSEDPARGTGDPVGTGGAVLDDTDWTALDVAGGAACGLKAGGELWCWGYGLQANTGNGEAHYDIWLRVPDIGL